MNRDAITKDRLDLTDYFEQTWIAREKLLDTAEKVTPEEWAQRRYPTPAAARAQGGEVAEITRSVLAEYASPAKLNETREVKGADGSLTRLTVEQILTHVFTHELRHQGQIQVVLRLLGKKPPNADWF